MVDRYVEETLYLVGVKVHRYHAVDTGGHQQVGYKFCGDRHTRFVLAVLTGPSEVGDNGYGGFCRCTLGGVYHQQEFHQVVAVGECGLHEIDFAAAYRFLKGHLEFAVGKVLDVHVAEFDAKVFANLFGQVARFGSGEDFERG